MKKVPNFEFHADTLKSKNILITGAGSGIGKQVALDAAKAGANLILLSKALFYILV
jgi:short-subunit dehydrogenase